jgi:choline-sulfatase
MQTRREFLATTTAAAATMARGATRPRPNILIIITDQQRAGMLGCAGNRYLQTPNMDSLAQTGVRFDRAYVTNPVCSPSRMSLMTGRMPSAIGMECNEDNASGRKMVPAEMLRDSLGRTFRGAGYQTVYAGKVHLPRAEGAKDGDQLDAYGFELLSRDQRGQMAASCAAFLREKHERPFLMVASFINPHDICFMAISAFDKATGQRSPEVAAKEARAGSPAEYLAQALRTPAGVSEEDFYRRHCPPLPANHEVPKNELSSFMVDKRAFQRWVREKWGERDWRMHRWAYARLTEQVDKEIGVVLKALRESGREKDTLVVLTSDHGDQDASHRLEHKEVLYEEAIRVPFILSGPGVTRAGAVDRAHLVSNGLDLIPTLCDFAGVEKPRSLHGRSLRPLAQANDPQWRDCLLVENHLARLVHGGRWKYMVGREEKHGDDCGICPGRIKQWDARVREMLVDLQADPGEMSNLAGERREQQRLQTGRRLLREWCSQNGVALESRYIVSA